MKRILLVLACAGCCYAEAPVKSWLAIPYAKPPVGDLRWRAPQPVGKWDGRAADQVGPACIQTAMGGQGGGRLPQSEDCLTLNVWAPADAHAAAVMVWIHGGAFVEGSGGLPFYNGAALAKQGVVVVTINYRLGVLGFFADPKLKGETGNFGIMDQIAALRWVQANIETAGGDPKNVTVFGESAGAMSVYALMTSPEARGLFAKAIAESGPIFGPMRTLAQMEKTDVERAVAWGATDAKALRALPVDKLKGGPLRDEQPVVDGKVITEDPRRVFAAGHQAAVPFLVGANSYEASLMAMLGSTGDAATFMNGGFLEPTRFLAASMDKVDQPAYLYYFSYVAERRRAEAKGAAHGGEVLYVFDNPVAGATAADRKMAETVSAYWVNFAKHGNPNGPGLVEWPAYSPATDRLLELGEKIEVRQHFKKQELDVIERLRSGAGRR